MADGTRYLCVHCDLTFAPEGEDEPRCPRCLRKNLVRRDAPAEVGPSKKGRLAIGVAGLALMLAFGAAYSLWASRMPGSVGDVVPAEPLTMRDLRGHLLRLGADRRELYAAFHDGPTVRRFFGELPDASAGAAAIERAVRAKLGSGPGARLVVVPQRGDRSGPFQPPATLANALGSGRGRVEVSSLEASLLALTALRAEGVEARIAEVWGFEGEATPPDPAGRVGYYVLAIPEREGTSIDAQRLVDLGVASGRRVTRGRARLLNDVEVISAVEVLSTAIALERDRDAAAAHTLAEEAIRLDPRSAAARSMRALTLAESGALEEAVAEARAALGLRDDAVHRVLLGGLLLPSGELDEASRLADRSVAEAPRYAGAQALVAAIALARGDVDAGRAAVAAARAADPTLASLPMLEAAMHALANEPEAAVASLRAYTAARPDDARVHAEAAGMYARLGMREATVTELRAAVARMHGEERTRFTQRIGEAFGPGVLADVVGLPDAGPDVPPEPEPPQPAAPSGLQLAPPSLGGRPQARPSILGPRP